MIIFLGLIVLGQFTGLLLTGAVVYLFHRYVSLTTDRLDKQLAQVSLTSLFLYRLAIFFVFGLQYLALLGYGTLTVMEELVLPVFITFFWLVSASAGYILIERRSRLSRDA